MMGVIA